MSKITEKDSHYRNLEKMSSRELLININREDEKVAHAVGECIGQIEALLDALYDRMSRGGRLFYIGAGTSGRLGILDASECPPTFGVDHGLVIGLIAGGDGAIRKAVEFAEDDTEQGFHDLQTYDINDLDFVVGIAASGSTPYVVGALNACRQNGIFTGCITCNPGSEITRHADYPIECAVGPEFVTGSTRMKSGTAQKLILNMISTSVMIKLGRVRDNKMVDMQLSNNKLVDRGIRMLMDRLELGREEAHKLLMTYGSVRNALDNHLRKS
jgi:N-acetylmuramic acid 6-phosphate etherase